MKNRRSFTEYVQDKFYDNMFIKVKKFIIENRQKLDIKSQSVDNIKYAELQDISVINVTVDNRPGTQIAFDVIVEAEIEIKDYNRHNDYEDTVTQWFMLSCNGDLSCLLTDFKINNVEIYDKRKYHENPMSDCLVPYIRSEELEEYATEFLKATYPEALQTPIYLDPMMLAERMNLNVIATRIAKEFTIFGASFFKECDTQYYDEEKDAILPLHVNEGTILVDKNAYFLRNLGCVNNTIVHECVHWHFHHKAFDLERLFNENASQIKCQVVGGIKDYNDRSSTDWMEWQANSLTPRIQMPLSSFKIKAHQLIQKYRKESQTFEIVDIMEPVIREIATFFGVSNFAAKIRMIDAGFHEAIGVMTYIDGRYIQPHGFRKDSITKKQTFSISIQDALAESAFSPNLKTSLAEGKYKYIDSHFVFNSPKYIALNENYEPCITEYARLHMDECCLIFDLKVKSLNKYGEDYYTDCVLFRDAESNITLEAHYSEDNKDHKAQAQQFENFRTDVLNVIKSLPNDFPGALNKVIEWSEMTEEQIAEAADLSTRSVQRLRNDDTQNPSLETMIQLCIGMRLPSMISFALIEKSGNSFMKNGLHFTYQFLLTAYESQSLEACNSFLIGQGIAVLGRTAKEEQKILQS